MYGSVYDSPYDLKYDLHLNRIGIQLNIDTNQPIHPFQQLEQIDYKFIQKIPLAAYRTSNRTPNRTRNRTCQGSLARGH
jgi:hypothetical protein